MLDRVITGDGGGDFGIVDSLGRRIPSRRRAEILARTETIRAHHAANMGEYRAAGALGITVLAEHLTAGDDRVCPQCAPLQGKRYELDEAEYMIPVHPQCRCVAIPYIPEDEDEPEEVGGVPVWEDLKSDSDITPDFWRMVSEKYFVNSVLRHEGDIDSPMGSPSIGHLNVLGQALSNMFRARPGLYKFFKDNPNIEFPSFAVANSTRIGSHWGDAVGLYHPMYKKITWANRFGYDLKNKLVLGKGKHNVDISRAGTIRHEYGHYLQNILEMDFRSLYDRLDWHNIYSNGMRNKRGTASMVSKYSTTNHNEYFAESFCAWSHPDYPKSKAKLPADVEEFFEEVFGDDS
jgi:SPP1 gp7 family putative phage head morphogenesis protein